MKFSIVLSFSQSVFSKVFQRDYFSVFGETIIAWALEDKLEKTLGKAIFFYRFTLTLYNHSKTMAVVSLLISKLLTKEYLWLKTNGGLNEHALNVR